MRCASSYELGATQLNQDSLGVDISSAIIKESQPLNAFSLLAVLAIICALGSIVAAVRIANDLRARGMTSHPTLVRWMVFKYMADYKRVTLSETGKVGPLYHQCATISAIAAILGIAAILAKVLSN